MVTRLGVPVRTVLLAVPLLASGCGESVPAPLAPAPAGMVTIPGGTMTMGEHGAPMPMPDGVPMAAAPRPVTVPAFHLDRTEVTNGDFARFVAATGHRTTAERPIDWATLQRELPPGTPRPSDAALRPGSLVFVPTPAEVPLDDERRWWHWTAGADWRHPEGPRSDLAGRARHPVVHVSYDDAVAYCVWAGKRLPSEAEWEYAARGGLEGRRFSWGDDPITPARANTWQGTFPVHDAGDDGHAGTAPVGSYPPNGYDLVDMAGNVWEWTADRYVETRGEADAATVAHVIRGGSFLCHARYCAGYRVAARMHASAATSLQHTGFRCAASIGTRTALATPVAEAPSRANTGARRR